MDVWREIHFILVLNQITEWQGLDSCDFRSFSTWCCQEVCLLWKLWRALQADLFSRLACRLFQCLVLFLSGQNFLLALGLSHVLDTNMNTLFDNSAIDQFIDTYTHRRLGHVKDNARASVVSLEGHTLVNGWIGVNIDIVAHLDFHQVLRQWDHSVRPERFGEHVARTRSHTK